MLLRAVNNTTFFTQFFRAQNSFKHISHSTSGIFEATQLP